MTGERLEADWRKLEQLLKSGTVAGLSDAQLLGRFATDNDGPAFEALVARHGPMVRATCRGILKDEHAAEDAFQGTFLALARKAGSVRSVDSLGAWLHRVARRASVEVLAAEARRRRVEAACPVSEVPDIRPRSIAAEEDWPILHEEIDRLPERYRAPIVLCYLEGMTHEQAAGHLDWPVGTVGGRLARAREQLRGRLIRRGVTAPVAALTLPPNVSMTLVPESWVRSAVSAATRGVTSAGASTLADLISAGLQTWKLKAASVAGLVAVVLAAGGVILAGSVRSGPARSGQAPASNPAVDDAKAGASVLVVDPEGRAVSGARVIRSETRFRSMGHEPVAAVRLAETGPDGSFRLTPEVAKAATDRQEWVVATATGFGPAFADPSIPDGLSRLKLVRDDVPIQGRVLDVDGRPIAGASVQLVRISWSPKETLDAFFEALQVERSPWLLQNQTLRSWSSDDIPSLFPKLVTDAQGRFTLRGVGRDRLVALVISGPGIETRFEYVATRVMPAVTYPPSSVVTRANQLVTYHGASFDVVAGPGLEMAGTVRDVDTGRPIAGILLQAAEMFGDPSRCLATTSDAEGRYRIAGVAPFVTSKGQVRAPGVIASATKEGPPYLSTYQPAEGRGPSIADFALKRGLWARGRVIDQATGRPVPAAVSYFVPPDNPNLKNYPSYVGMRPMTPLETEADGEYRVVVIPGRGILAARCGHEGYRVLVGFDEVARLDPPKPGTYPSIQARPQQMNGTNFNRLKEINPAPGDEAVRVDLFLDHGRTVRGRLIGPDGAEVAGAIMYGVDPPERWSGEPLPTAEFQVRALGPDDRRFLNFRHDAKNLAGAYVLRPKEEDPLTIRLQFGGTLTGRLVDDDGRPRARVALDCFNTPAPIQDDSWFQKGSLPGLIWTDEGGRFRASALVPGLKYSLMDRGAGWAVRDGVVGPGEVKDLGDIRVEPFRKP